MMAVACHNPQGPVSTAASVQVAFATPNYLIQEVVRKDVPWRKDVVIGQIPIENGHAVPPTAPGLGIDINEAEADKHPWQPLGMSSGAALHRVSAHCRGEIPAALRSFPSAVRSSPNTLEQGVSASQAASNEASCWA